MNITGLILTTNINIQWNKKYNISILHCYIRLRLDSIQFSLFTLIHTKLIYRNRKEKLKGKKQRKSSLHVD